tara:strand:- start:769 stop:1338 length:570 start_codon:yes stop_codon:yes gene_type:complete
MNLSNYSLNISNKSDVINVSSYSLFVTLIATSPLICLIILGLVTCYISIEKKFKKFKNDLSSNCKNCFCKNCFTNKQLVNNQLSNKFINKLNKKNKCPIKENNLECSICLEPIIENSKGNIYLQCNHIFHKDCVQEWVKSQININKNINCPLCRYTIINIPKNNYVDTTNHNYSSDSDSSMSLSEFYGI